MDEITKLMVVRVGYVGLGFRISLSFNIYNNNTYAQTWWSLNSRIFINLLIFDEVTSLFDQVDFDQMAAYHLNIRVVQLLSDQCKFGKGLFKQHKLED